MTKADIDRVGLTENEWLAIICGELDGDAAKRGEGVRRAETGAAG